MKIYQKKIYQKKYQKKNNKDVSTDTSFFYLKRMSLSYSRIAGNDGIEEGFQIVRDGSHKIYYIDQPIDVLKEHDGDAAEDLVTDLVDDVVTKLRLYNLTTKKLIDVDSDVIAKDAPRDRHAKRVFAGVKDELSKMESKYYESQHPLQIIPRKIPSQRDAYYIFGPSGSGKSTWASKYARAYQEENPGNRVFIFSRKEFDPVFDGVVPNIIRVVMDRNFVREHQRRPGDEDPIAFYENSLVIFDDFLKIEDVTIRKSAEHLKNSLYELGRQYSIDICSIQHKGLGGAKSIIELAESSVIVCFIKINMGESERLVQKYLCFSKDQMLRIFDEAAKKERWMAIIRPNIIVTEHYIKVID